MSSCCCSSSSTTTVIDLTEPFLNRVQRERTTTKSNTTTTTHEKLRSALQEYGWCHVSLSKDTTTLPHFNKSWFLSSLFSSSNNTTTNLDGAIYRGRSAESGSTTSTEPKQSWEVSRRCCTKKKKTTTLLDPYLQTMHTIAVTIIADILELPSMIVQEDTNNNNSNSNNYTTTACCRCSNIDLLRVFLYDPITTTTTTTADEVVLGSSPHTDWGTLTVVWQDDTATTPGDSCLQTYCPVHQIYVDVNSPTTTTSNDDNYFFVVHVGDVSSLVLGRHAAAATTKNNNGNNDDTTTKKKKMIQFPSPLHRVQCPQKDGRISLVYFCYPPPSLSLSNLEEQIKITYKGEESTDDDNTTTVVPYESYYLLQNQQQQQCNINKKADDPELVYHQIRNQPLGIVFQNKWNQVQRN